MPPRIEPFGRCDPTGLLPKRTKLRSSKYLTNVIEQDHRGISPEPAACLVSKTSNPLLSPSLASNCFVAFSTVSSLWVA